jgi:hypothetical protein
MKEEKRRPLPQNEILLQKQRELDSTLNRTKEYRKKIKDL